MYVEKDLKLAPLMEQADEDMVQYCGDDDEQVEVGDGKEGQDDGIIVGGGDNNDENNPVIVRNSNEKIMIYKQDRYDRIEKTFYGRIQLGGGSTATDNHDDAKSKPIIVEHHINRPLKGEKQ